MNTSRSPNWEEQSSPASRSSNWKENFSSMETQADNAISRARAEAGLPDLDKGYTLKIPAIVANTIIENKNRNKVKHIIGKDDADFLVSIRNFLYSYAKREEEIKKCKRITVINKDQFNIDPDSIEALIGRILQNEEKGLHITDIITKLEQLGWQTTSTYHKYNAVYRAINKHYYMFEKMGKAMFRLRNAFSNRPVDKTPISHSELSKEPLTIKDVVVEIFKTFSTSEGLYPSLVWSVMRKMGYDYSYSAIRKVMQDKKNFKRSGFIYSLKSKDASKKTPTKNNST